VDRRVYLRQQSIIQTRLDLTQLYQDPTNPDPSKFPEKLEKVIL
jgi:hypothetical protein